MAVILAFGGRSRERWVSTATAQSLSQVYDFDAIWFFSFQGEVFEVSREELLAFENPYGSDFVPTQSDGRVETKQTHRHQIRKRWSNRGEAFLSLQKKSSDATSPNLHSEPDVIFLGFHGTDGEDGVIQSELEALGIAFTGSGSNSSRTGFHKENSKRRVESLGIKVIESEPLSNIEGLRSAFQRMGALVVKPVAEGSSFGLNFVFSEPDIERVFRSIEDDQKSGGQLSADQFMVERFVAGRELTVGVLESDSEAFALVPTEIAVEQGRVFDYKGKYLGEGVREITPAKLTVSEYVQARKTALQAHQAIGCYGYSRTDMILTEHGDIYFLEINTLPGLTKASLIPQQLSACGISLSSFVEDQLQLARKR